MTARITASTSVEDLAALVCATLEHHGIDAVLTGGAVVSIYTCNAYVEFPSGPLAIGNEPVARTAVRRRPTGVLRLLTPTDCVMDRLAAFYHWNDAQGLEQAVAVSKRQRIDIRRVRTWSRREGMAAKFAVFESRVSGRRPTKRPTPNA